MKTTFVCLTILFSLTSLADMAFSLNGINNPTDTANGLFLDGSDAESLFLALKVKEKLDIKRNLVKKFLPLDGSSVYGAKRYMECIHDLHNDSYECFAGKIE